MAFGNKNAKLRVEKITQIGFMTLVSILVWVSLLLIQFY